MRRGKRKQSLDEDEQESPGKSSSEDESSQDIVNVDFEFFDPKPEDFHGVKALLRSYLHEAEWNLSDFVDLILKQTTVGTVVKAGEDQGPIGVITALNIGRYKEHSAIQSIKEFLAENCKDPKLESLWNSNKNVGLLVSERFVNVPLEVCQPLYRGLFDEIAWATEDEPSEELRKSYKFDCYLIITRVYQEVRTKNARKKQKSKAAEEPGNEELVFIKPEDELFLQLSSFSIKFPIRPGALAAHETKGLKLFALVMAVKAKQVKTFQSKLQEMIDSVGE